MKTYTYKEVVDSSIEYFNGDELAAKVFADKYALQNLDGEYLELTPTDMHHRLAKEFARIESKYPNPMTEEEIFSLFDRFKYVVPQGSPMSGIGNPYQIQSISNCFVLHPPTDSYAGILYTDQEQAQIMKRRGGVGFDISKIRPKGGKTSNASKTTDGIGLFMQRFSATTAEVAQGGRRGALMLTISVHHPEIRTFINIKRDTKKVTGANISVKLSHEFMDAVKNKAKVQLRWPVDSENPTITEKVDANELWTELISASHASAEPGILFWDTAIENTPSDIYKEKGFGSSSTNPCFSGNTMIAVADGRNAVSIKELADEGRDVPVYSTDMNGKVSIKTGRNPRITGTNKELVRVHLDDGGYLDVTPDHKFLTFNFETVEAKDLQPGQSLPRFNKTAKPFRKGGKDYYLVNSNTRDAWNLARAEHRLIAKFNEPEKWDEMHKTARESNYAEGKIVIHHRDFTGTNNSPDNLQICTNSEHKKIHADLSQGDNNGRYLDVTHDEIRQHAINLTKKLNYRFAHTDWLKYANENNLPQNFSEWRRKALGSLLDLAIWAAQECNIQNTDVHPRTMKALTKAKEQGYEAFIGKYQGRDETYIKRSCEGCSEIFSVIFDEREVSFCSEKCYHEYRMREKLKEKLAFVNNDLNYKNKQIKTYLNLKFQLKRHPISKEWKDACLIDGVSSELGKSDKLFKTFKEVRQAAQSANHKVVRVEKLEDLHTVYNITVDDNHTVGIITHVSDKAYTGVYVRQCGEIILSPRDSCRLLLINLTGFVNNPFTDKAEFNFKEYAKVVNQAQKLMDDLVDLELECVDKILAKIESDPEPEHVKRIEKDLWLGIREAAVNGRRTGLGITALGDCLAALNIRYGSDESIVMTEEIYKHLAVNSYKSSIIMAKERGAFPVFSHDLERGHQFLQRIWDADPEVYDLYQKHGRRNIANTTTAPAGSVSTLTQTTSGIEPVFMLSYTRRKKVNPDSKDVKIDFVDGVGDSWQEYPVYHHGLKTWMDITGKTDPKESPYHMATAMDNDWVQGVKLQGAAQKWICHAISRTANLPADTTVDTVKDIYMMAWEKGCKGYTIYRDGCRSGVLISSDKKEIDKSGRPLKIIPTQSPKRPEELPCDIHHVTIKGTKWTILVGLLHGDPYEMFIGHSELISLPTKASNGKIYKKTKGKYDLHVDGEDLVIKDIIKTFDSKDSAWATRMFSINLRHGVSVEFLVDQLSKDGLITDFNKVIARILKKYIKDGTSVKTSEKCSNVLASGDICNSGDLVFQEGCLMCKECGYSKCG